MLNHLLVAIGGGFGALMRYRVGIAMKALLPGYVASGTLFVNVVGSLAIGYSLGVSQDSKTISESARLFFIVGILGGLTTFSSLVHETATLTHTPEAGLVAGLGHLSANVIFGLGAVWLGAWCARGVHTGL
jgi:CrcB protein